MDGALLEVATSTAPRRARQAPGPGGILRGGCPQARCTACPPPREHTAIILDDSHSDGPRDADRARRLELAQLLQRVFAIDVLTCPRCRSPTRLVSVIDDERIASKILVLRG